jgi:hypothetical protein
MKQKLEARVNVEQVVSELNKYKKFHTVRFYLFMLIRLLFTGLASHD